MITKLQEIDKYTYRVEWSLEDDSYIARCLEFPSLSAFGDSHEQALSELKAVVSLGIKKMTQESQPIPEPLSEKKYSGEFRLRVGKGLHRELAIDAASEGLSLNTLVLSRLKGSKSDPLKPSLKERHSKK